MEVGIAFLTGWILEKEKSPFMGCCSKWGASWTRAELGFIWRYFQYSIKLDWLSKWCTWADSHYSQQRDQVPQRWNLRASHKYIAESHQVCIKQAKRWPATEQTPAALTCSPPVHPNSQDVLCLATSHEMGRGRRRKEGEQELPLLVTRSYWALTWTSTLEQGRECKGQSRDISHPASDGKGGAEAKNGAIPWAAQQDLREDASLWPGGADDSPPVCAQKMVWQVCFQGG